MLGALVPGTLLPGALLPGALVPGALVLGALALAVPVLALRALEPDPLALARDSGRGRGLPTCGTFCARELAVSGAGIAGGDGGLGAARGAPRSDDGVLPGPNSKIWPTEMRKSAPMLFHRAKSR